MTSPAPTHLKRQRRSRGNSGPSVGTKPGLAFMLVVAAFIAGCGYQPVIPHSEGHISAEQVGPKVGEIPQPVKTSRYVPPPKPLVKPDTYSVVVNEVPVKELLFALARDSRQNIDIHPGLTGLVSLNAIDETLSAILDRIARQVNIRYRMEGNTLVVMPDLPYLKTYKVNYVNMTRDTSSTIGVSGQISGSGAIGTTSPSSSGGDSDNTSSTKVKTVSNNNFWELLRSNIHSILNSSRASALTAEDKATRAENLKASKDERIQQAEAVSRAGTSAEALFKTAFGGSAAAAPSDLKDDIIVNSMAGTVSIIATEKEQALIQQYLDGVSSSVQRQVLIEATIVEVRLSQDYQAGVDWSRLAISGGLDITQALLGANLGTPPNLTIAYKDTNNSLGNITATVKLLEQFGRTKVLSSPKLMALNNQTALLKVVDNIVFFTIEQETNTTQGVVTNTITTTPQTVPVGVIMSVTPQINENGAVTLTVRPTISRILDFAVDPNPELTVVQNLIPIIQVREMESVLQVGSNQTVILGGLMQDDVTRNRDSVPGIGKAKGIGEIFSFRDESVSKTELVIFLRPTVIANPSLESDELKFFQRFLPQKDSPTAEQP